MKKLVLSLTGVAAAAAALTLTVSPADAATSPNALHVSYDAVGTTTVAKTGSSLKLGPTTLSTALNPDGTFTGSLPIPPSSTTFKAIGLVPASATVNFIPAGQVTGKLGADSTGAIKVNATAKYTLRLSNVKLAGIPTDVGSSCQTVTPAVIPVGTPAGQSFNVTSGGTVSGTYTIPLFANCGLTTGLIDALVPGPNNTVSFTLSNGRITS